MKIHHILLIVVIFLIICNYIVDAHKSDQHSKDTENSHNHQDHHHKHQDGLEKQHHNHHNHNHQDGQDQYHHHHHSHDHQQNHQHSMKQDHNNDIIVDKNKIPNPTKPHSHAPHDEHIREENKDNRNSNNKQKDMNQNSTSNNTITEDLSNKGQIFNYVNNFVQNSLKTSYKSLMNAYDKYLTTKIQQIIFSVLLISMPSLPVFFLLYYISKCFRSKDQLKKHLLPEGILNVMISFSIGTLLGDVTLHIFPYLFQQTMTTVEHSHDHHHDHDHDHGHESSESHFHSEEQSNMCLKILLGVLIFFILDYVFNLLKPHSHDDHNHVSKPQDKKQHHDQSIDQKDKKLQQDQKKKNIDKIDRQQLDISAYCFLIADFLHNFTDGLAVGTAFSISISLGITTTIGIIFHEMPHEIGDFAVLIKKNMRLDKILWTQILTSFGCLLGGFLGLKFGEIYKLMLLSITAGGFLYMSLAQLMPEIIEYVKKRNSFFIFFFNLLFMVFGIYTMYCIALFE